MFGIMATRPEPHLNPQLSDSLLLHNEAAYARQGWRSASAPRGGRFPRLAWGGRNCERTGISSLSLHPIEDYAFLSDCRSMALVSPRGSIDWWCVPRIDAPSVFGRLLDLDIGHWELAPARKARARREYLADTLVLQTTWTTDTGTALVTDALALEPGAREHDIGVSSPAILCRQVRGITGTVSFRTEVTPRFEYGLVTPRLRPHGATVEATAGPVTLVLMGDVPMVLRNTSAHAEFTVRAGQVSAEPVERRCGVERSPLCDREEVDIPRRSAAENETWAAQS